MEPNPMDALAALVFKAFIAIAIIYAWTYSYNKPSKFRGGDAQNMVEEFAVYGFPAWVVTLVRVVKLSLAVSLLLGYAFPVLVKPTALALTFIMLVAVLMHLKIRRDSLFKAIPAYLLLSFSIFLVFD
tara:strand:+ start:106 stop:489 length:384 start_codon:yes stop_codon:yes gene_type:complete